MYYVILMEIYYYRIKISDGRNRGILSQGKLTSFVTSITEKVKLLMERLLNISENCCLRVNNAGGKKLK